MKTVFLVLDHGLGLGYFFETDITKNLLEQGVRVVFLVQDAMLPHVRKKINHPNVFFESMRDGQVRAYQQQHHPGIFELIEHVRRTSGKYTIPLTYMDTNRRRKEYEAKGRRKQILKLLRPIIYANRYSRLSRFVFRKKLQWFDTPHLYDDLFDKYQPDLVVSDTAGWRLDQYILREATRRGVKTATVIIGWDNPSSQGLPGAFVDYVNVWSEVHKWELTEGTDWKKENVFVGGMPLYDGYISKKWLIPRDEYFRMHGLDPNKKLVAFAATALNITPNLHIIEEMAKIIASGDLAEPTQLLIRLHPNHFKEQENYRTEYQQIMELVERHSDVHVVEPKETPEGMERYSGEDFPEKTSMLTHCDVLATIYSTMVVESALHDTPFISVCINAEDGWGKDKFWVPLEEVPGWPTALRVNAMEAGKTVFNAVELKEAINAYVADKTIDHEQRMAFAESELTYLHGESTQKTTEFLLGLLNQN
ncbi:MAG: hypothetical protein JW750_06010 [Anaerolineaceae bacterium]|nr:hypothetical protein [Anaerolineaceae bacterium]